MTGKADFAPDEWEIVLKGPPSAGMIVITAQRGGTFRESFSMAKAYAEARKQHGDSELLDEIASTKPEIDHTRYHSPEELKGARPPASSGRRRSYWSERRPRRRSTSTERFVLTLANRVADTRKEGFLGLSGERVSEAEQAAVAEVAEAVGGQSP